MSKIFPMNTDCSEFNPVPNCHSNKKESRASHSDQSFCLSNDPVTTSQAPSHSSPANANHSENNVNTNKIHAFQVTSSANSASRTAILAPAPSSSSNMSSSVTCASTPTCSHATTNNQGGNSNRSFVQFLRDSFVQSRKQLIGVWLNRQNSMPVSRNVSNHHRQNNPHSYPHQHHQPHQHQQQHQQQHRHSAGLPRPNSSAPANSTRNTVGGGGGRATTGQLLNSAVHHLCRSELLNETPMPMHLWHLNLNPTSYSAASLPPFSAQVQSSAVPLQTVSQLPPDGTQQHDQQNALQPTAGCKSESKSVRVGIAGLVGASSVCSVKSVASSNGTMSERQCRICQEYEPADQLVSPCLCAGSLKFIHQSCLQRWIKAQESRPACELCRHQFQMRIVTKSLLQWEIMPMTPTEKRKIICSVVFHAIALVCVIWSLYVLIERTVEEMREGHLYWPFWTKLAVVVVGLFGGAVFMYVQIRLYVSLCRRWRSYNRTFLVQSIDAERLAQARLEAKEKALAEMEKNNQRRHIEAEGLTTFNVTSTASSVSAATTGTPAAAAGDGGRTVMETVMNVGNTTDSHIVTSSTEEDGNDGPVENIHISLDASCGEEGGEGRVRASEMPLHETYIPESNLDNNFSTDNHNDLNHDTTNNNNNESESRAILESENVTNNKNPII